MPERNDYIIENDARTQLAEVLGKVREDRSLGTETKAGDDNASVDYHIDNILKAGGGIWNETIARDYIQNLQAQAGKETSSPATPL